MSLFDPELATPSIHTNKERNIYMVQALETKNLNSNLGFATSKVYKFGQVTALNFHSLFCKV